VIKKATYLVSIFIGEPTEQHAKIKDIAAQVSDGEYEFLHLHRMGAFLVLNTGRDAGQLAKSFAQATASADRIFVCELGQDFQALGLSKATYWLSNHLVTKPQTLSARHGNPFTDA
jgi:hypothetical protein